MIATVVCLNTECALYDMEDTARASFEAGLYFLADEERSHCEGCGEALSVLGAENAL